MADPRPRWILCGGATHREAPQNALRIGLGEGPWHQVTVNIEGVESALTGRLPGDLRDLIRIAAYVLAADCATPRGTLTAADNGASWRRDFRFVVPVSEPDRWRQRRLRRALETTLGFMSDDSFRFEFVRGTCEEGRQVAFRPAGDGRTLVSWDHMDDVLLFSGGMDSFAGAAEETLVQRRRPLLVSHRASAKMQAVQRRLVDELRERAGGHAPWYLGVDIHRHSDALRKEDSQRTRSFLYASIAGAVAWLSGRRRVRFHENGVIALNLPISAQLVGARGTRTAHPRILEGFATLLGLLTDEPFILDNPYQWLTRAEVAVRIREAGVRDLLRHTRSCAGIRHATTMHPFCGVCSQCVDRQFAVRAAWLAVDDPDEMYEVRIFDSPLEDDRHVQLALGYVSAAKAFASVATPQELGARYGEVFDALPELARQWSCTQDEARERVLDLHQRQGKMVLDVLASEFQARTPDLIAGNIHPASLLARCAEEGIRTSKQVYGVEVVAGRAQPTVPALDAAAALAPAAVLGQNVFVREGDGWLVGLCGDRGKIVKHSAGMPLICVLLRHPNREFSSLELEAVAKGEKPPADKPGALPTMDSAYIADVKAKVAELAEEEAEAETMGDRCGAMRARAEREKLEDRLRADLRLGREARAVPPEVEKSKDRVTKAIDRALQDIKRVGAMPTWRHLYNALEKGYSPAYKPTTPTLWVTESRAS